MDLWKMPGNKRHRAHTSQKFSYYPASKLPLFLTLSLLELVGFIGTPRVKRGAHLI